MIEPLFKALNQARVRYVVVGGVATVLHGFPRLTVDVDLIVDLFPEEAARAIATLTSLGLVPRVPVRAEEFADPVKRRQWITEKSMRVFTMIDPANPLRQVDLFVEPPIEFEDLLDQSETVELATTHVRIASIPHLIRMKELAGRPQDRTDIEALQAILAERRR